MSAGFAVNTCIGCLSLLQPALSTYCVPFPGAQAWLKEEEVVLEGVYTSPCMCLHFQLGCASLDFSALEALP